MQTGRKKELPKRSRYYQSVADVSTTSTGAKYRNLPDNILIFICCFDPFNRGRPIYRFQNICLDDEPIFLNDGTQKLFLNTTCKDTGSLDGELRLFYDYVRERTARTAFTKELDNSISKLKQNQEERRMSLLYASRMMESHQDGYAVGLERGLASGREEGISIGLERGAYQTKLETARNLLSEGLIPQMVARCTDLPLETVLELAQKR